MQYETHKVMSEKKEVGQVSAPVFEFKNPDIGLQEIQSFDWTKPENGGYKNTADAIVSLVNTQHATNLRNKLRQAKSGKMTAAAITAAAMATCTMQELQGAVGDPAAFIALQERKVREFKADMEAKKAAGSQPTVEQPVANGVVTEEQSQEEADAEAAEAVQQ